MELRIIDLIKYNTFFNELSNDEKIRFIQENSDEKFGEDVIMYYFYRKGFSINFIIDVANRTINSEQVEINSLGLIRNTTLQSCKSTEILTKNFIEEIDSAFKYADDIETIYEVYFLKNRVSFHFYNRSLRKIISENIGTFKFITKTMVPINLK